MKGSKQRRLDTLRAERDLCERKLNAASSVVVSNHWLRQLNRLDRAIADREARP